ncbi:hypothetical protein SPSYN_01380 [Sporotomaculum syntrophicum]|uniref:Uncharacterized protein n=1 Tax=Sporotomaculum syntrophicum TaxID=182264 RepID=A0A9D3AYW7_9FIRM|nr:hypothetical protein [Sporotomaculum syntrophicum]KAF1085244.1 hypothetical protein SPSYN_01380 [Sporotomaculum syntrophicum]
MQIIDILLNSYHGFVWKLCLYILLPVIIIDFAVQKLPWFTKKEKKLVTCLAILIWLVVAIKSGFFKIS